MAAQRDFKVGLTKTAEQTYTKIYDEAQACIERGDESNSKVTLLSQVDEAILKIIPHDPFNPNRALSGQLSNIFRVSKGRMRIFYVVSSRVGEIVVLYISDTPRKQGDIRDPYSLFTRMVMSGQFDHVFDKLGVKRPTKSAAGIQTFIA